MTVPLNLGLKPGGAGSKVTPVPVTWRDNPEHVLNTNCDAPGVTDADEVGPELLNSVHIMLS